MWFFNHQVRVISFFVVGFFCVLLVTFLPSRVIALEYGGFGGRPAYPREDNPRTKSIFIHILEPGATQTDGLLTINNTGEKKTMLVYAVDSTPSTGGAFACAQFLEDKKDVGAWIALEKTEVTLEPGTSELVPFTIQVPQSASVSEHNGCIVMQEKKEQSQKGNGASLSFRTALRVVITIPGDLIRKLEIVDFVVHRRDNGNYFLQPSVKNLGNVSIDTNVKITTRYFFGLIHFTHGGQYPILRGEISDWNFELKKPFWGGWYRADLSVEYDEHAAAGVGVHSGEGLTRLRGQSVWFFSFPTLPALLIEIVTMLLFGFGFFLFLLARRRLKWIRENWIFYTIQSGDDINMLANRFDVAWRLLAKINKLKPPYALKSGTIIRVPPTK